MATPKERKERKTLSIKSGEQKPALPEKAAGAKQPTPKHESEVTATILNDEDMADVRAVISRIEDIFNAVGTSQLPDTVLPRAKNRNNADAAAEFVLADKLRKLADARHKAAKEKAEREGVFGEEEQYVAGESVIVWQSPFYTISMKLGNETKMVNREKVEETLRTYLPREKAEEAFEKCMKPREPARQIIVSMK